MEPCKSQNDQYTSAEFLPVGTRLLGGQYVIERYLGSGGFGITYVARDSLDRQVVIKECFPEALCQRKNRTVVERSRSSKGQFHSIVEMFVREARSLARLQHRNIVGVHQVFKDNETAYMALDLIQGQDLLDIIDTQPGCPPYREAKSVLWRLLDAIAVVHDEDMLHRDISPDNILIDVSGSPVLIDFGAAREEASKKSRALSAVQVVKDGYSPQEFYVAGSQQGPYSDLYALAATFVHVISGEAPPNSQIRLAAIANKKPDPFVPLTGRIEDYPKPFLAALDQAMAVFPKDRIQSAREWMARIDERSGPTVPLPSGKAARDIEQTVTQLIATVQKEAGPAPVEDTPKQMKAIAPDPAPARPEVSFKQRFAELALPLEPDLEPSQASEEDEPDWIEKARQKQQARLAEAEAAMETYLTQKAKPRIKTKSTALPLPLEGPTASKMPMILTVAGALVFAIVLGLNGHHIAALVTPGGPSVEAVQTPGGEDVL
jgi:serine/threonine protein kinase